MHLANHKINVIKIPAVLNPDTISELWRQWSQVNVDAARYVVLKGNKDTFCLGMDIRWIAGENINAVEEEIHKFSSFLKNLRTSPCIIIALAEGETTGGGLGIAAAGDVVIAGQNSTFRLTEGLLGLIPGIILPSLLSRLSPKTIKKMVFSAKKYTASEAMEIGLADEVCAEDEIETRVNSRMNVFKGCKKQSVKDLKSVLEKWNTSNGASPEERASLLTERLKEDEIRNRITNLAQCIAE